jgi:hypothetical protein
MRRVASPFGDKWVREDTDGTGVSALTPEQMKSARAFQASRMAHGTPSPEGHEEAADMHDMAAKAHKDTGDGFMHEEHKLMAAHHRDAMLASDKA